MVANDIDPAEPTMCHLVSWRGKREAYIIISYLSLTSRALQRIIMRKVLRISNLSSDSPIPIRWTFKTDPVSDMRGLEAKWAVQTTLPQQSSDFEERISYTEKLIILP